MNFQNHIRLRPNFEDIFQRSMHETIASMDSSGRDIPNQSPSTPLKLTRMGTNRRSVPINLRDPFGSAESVTIYCKLDAYVDLDADRRGIHVSRIGDLVARLTQNTFDSLQQYAVEFARQLQKEQGSNLAHVALTGVFSYLEPVTGFKNKSSLEHITLLTDVIVKRDEISTSTGISFNHITACPCVQETYRNSFGADAADMLALLDQNNVPMLTHTQRCETRILFCGLSSELPLRSLMDHIDAVVVRSQNTLPREFELSNVYLAHAKPQFLEDVLRDLMNSVYYLVGPSSPDAAINIRSISMESIHDFDIEGEIAYTVRDLGAILSAKK